MKIYTLAAYLPRSEDRELLAQAAPGATIFMYPTLEEPHDLEAAVVEKELFLSTSDVILVDARAGKGFEPLSFAYGALNRLVLGMASSVWIVGNPDLLNFADNQDNIVLNEALQEGRVGVGDNLTQILKDVVGVMKLYD